MSDPSSPPSGALTAVANRPAVLLLTGGFLFLYLLTLCRTVYLGDSGEIATAIATGGIVHPPGYPIFSLLGRLFLTLVPVGEPAFRIGCLVAAAGAGAVAAVYAIAREAGTSRVAAVVGAATFGTGYTFWSQCTRVEVYSLHVLFGLLVLLGALRYSRTGRRRDLALVALAAGLGIGHHITIVLLAPAAFVLCGRRLWYDPGLFRRVWLSAGLVLVGPLSYLVLWLRAVRQPLYNWGRPETPSLLWSHATGALFRSNLALPDADHLRTSLPAAGAYLLDSFPYGLFLLAFAGVWRQDRQQRKTAVGLLLAAGVLLVYNQCYRISDLAAYYLIPWGCVAVFVAAGWHRLIEPLSTRPASRRIHGALAVLAIGLPLVRNYAAADLSRVTWVREFARQKLSCTDQNAVLLSDDDTDTFPLWYVQALLQVRPDVAILDRSLVQVGLVGLQEEPSGWYFRHLRQRNVPGLVPPPRSVASRVHLGYGGWLIHILARDTPDRPWCVTFGENDHAGRPNPSRAPLLAWLRRRRKLVPQGLVLRVVSPRRLPPVAETLALNRDLWSRIALPQFGATRLDQDLTPEYVRDIYASRLSGYAQLHAQAGLTDAANELYRSVIEFAPGHRNAGEQREGRAADSVRK